MLNTYEVLDSQNNVIRTVRASKIEVEGNFVSFIDIMVSSTSPPSRSTHAIQRLQPGWIVAQVLA